ncbi:MAG: galactosyldiacylglycerol synthase [Burkholderiaceae bacterium]|jgi:processive 1,2-diacylglycerol beta-glucosyltransferase|nr:galactosyldiacylglycerol synthase [Burkholderiaceae bacterium]
MQPVKKILLLSLSAGNGHTRAAEALGAFAAIHPAGIEAVHLDVAQFASARARKFYVDGYLKVSSERPQVWRYIYQKTDVTPPDALLQRLRSATERFCCRALLPEIERQRPDAIICTHFLPAGLLSHELCKGRPIAPVWVQLTDFDLHSLWLVPKMRGYFAGNEEIAWRTRQRGIAADAVSVSGIPVMPAFSAALNRRECAAQLGLDPARKTLLLMGGGAGVGRLDLLAARLLAMPVDFQLIVLAGRNQTMLNALQNLARQHPGRLLAQGYTEQVERFMACADLIITKPGGLTTAECLAIGLPMIVYSPVPEQEERNADFLLEQGAALKAIDSDAVAFRVAELLQAPERLAAMRRKSAALGRPQAGRFVLDRVLGLTTHAIPRPAPSRHTGLDCARGQRTRATECA